ncbi:MAG: hypothetical protein R3225_08315 [Halofilum sp. (in: g-proteobacteria)]|nr:hypothetical protein [Halofilum sp. (in: g-proteobacteria)]
MNCERFRAYWSDWHDGRLNEGAAAMVTHRNACDACARYDRQMRRLLEELGTLPLPAAAPVPAASPRRVAAPRWAALAATLAVGIALGLLIGERPGEPATIRAEPVVLEGGAEQRIAIAIESRHAYEQVEFVVELPPGVELSGFPGQRNVRWQGSLAEGRSRLQLPLRLTGDGGGGELVTRIVHEAGERRLVVPLRAGSGNGVGMLDRASV